MPRKTRKQMEEILGTMMSEILTLYERSPQDLGLPAAVTVSVVWVPVPSGEPKTTLHAVKHNASELTDKQALELTRAAIVQRMGS